MLLTLAIIATILIFISFVAGVFKSAKENEDNTEKVALISLCIFLNRAFLVTVIWILYSY
jgi:hypothetical protein